MRRLYLQRGTARAQVAGVSWKPISQGGIDMLLQHAGLRTLWPVMLFLPWVLVGVAFLVKAIHGRKESRSLRPQGRAG